MQERRVKTTRRKLDRDSEARLGGQKRKGTHITRMGGGGGQGDREGLKDPSHGRGGRSALEQSLQVGRGKEGESLKHSAFRWRTAPILARL